MGNGYSIDWLTRRAWASSRTRQLIFFKRPRERSDPLRAHPPLPLPSTKYVLPRTNTIRCLGGRRMGTAVTPSTTQPPDLLKRKLFLPHHLFHFSPCHRSRIHRTVRTTILPSTHTSSNRMPMRRTHTNSRTCAPTLPKVRSLAPKSSHRQRPPTRDLLPFHTTEANRRISLTLGKNGRLRQAADSVGAGVVEEEPAAKCGHTTTR